MLRPNCGVLFSETKTTLPTYTVFPLRKVFRLRDQHLSTMRRDCPESVIRVTVPGPIEHLHDLPELESKRVMLWVERVLGQFDSGARCGTERLPVRFEWLAAT